MWPFKNSQRVDQLLAENKQLRFERDQAEKETLKTYDDNINLLGRIKLLLDENLKKDELILDLQATIDSAVGKDALPRDPNPNDLASVNWLKDSKLDNAPVDAYKSGKNFYADGDYNV